MPVSKSNYRKGAGSIFKQLPNTTAFYEQAPQITPAPGDEALFWRDGVVGRGDIDNFLDPEIVITGVSIGGSQENPIPTNQTEFALMVYGTGLSEAHSWSISGKGIEIVEVIESPTVGAALVLNIAENALPGVRTLRVRAFGQTGVATSISLFIALAPADIVEASERASFGTEILTGVAAGWQSPGNSLSGGDFAMVGAIGFTDDNAWTALRIPDVALPANHVVDEAIFSYIISGVGGSAFDAEIVLALEKNPSAPGSPNLPSDWVLGTPIPLSGTSTTGTKTVDITSAVNELLGNVAWTSGDSINILIRPVSTVSSSSDLFSIDSSVSGAANTQLTISHRYPDRAEIEAFNLSGARLVSFWPATRDQRARGVPFIATTRGHSGESETAYFRFGTGTAVNKEIPRVGEPTGVFLNVREAFTEFGGGQGFLQGIAGTDVLFPESSVGTGWVANLRTKSYVLMMLAPIGNIFSATGGKQFVVDVFGDSFGGLGLCIGESPAAPVSAENEAGVFVGATNFGMAATSVTVTRSTSPADQIYILALAWDYENEELNLWLKDADGVKENSASINKPNADINIGWSGMAIVGGFYGGILWAEFDSLPADWKDAVEWMGESWKNDNKAIYPAWRSTEES